MEKLVRFCPVALYLLQSRFSAPSVEASELGTSKEQKPENLPVERHESCKLPNGLILCKEHTSPLVAVNLRYTSGF